MKRALLALGLLLVGCGDVGSSDVQLNQQQGIGALPQTCSRDCHLVTDSMTGTPTVDYTVTCSGLVTDSGSTAVIPSDCVFPAATAPVA